MSEPFLGEVKLMSFTFPPRGWIACSGQLLPINQNQALYSLLGTMYGGDGRVNFAIPNLQGRTVLHRGNSFTQGSAGGQEANTLGVGQLPLHGHTLMANPGQPAQQNPQNPSPTRRLAASQPGNLWGPPTNLQSMLPAAIGNVGGSQPHENRQPWAVIAYCMAIVGIFPSQN